MVYRSRYSEAAQWPAMSGARVTGSYSPCVTNAVRDNEVGYDRFLALPVQLVVHPPVIRVLAASSRRKQGYVPMLMKTAAKL